MEQSLIQMNVEDARNGVAEFLIELGYADKLSAGLQQFMAGARKFNLKKLSRDDLIASNRETAEVANVPFMTEALDEQAKAVLLG